MSTNNASGSGRPVAIAIAPAPSSSGPDVGAHMRASEQISMPYTCQTCAKRKVKCDKISPTCSACRRGKLSCSYRTPQSRSRKRKTSDGDNDDDIKERLAQYERILHQHGLLEKPDSSPPAERSAVVAEKGTSKEDSHDDDPITLNWHEPLLSIRGRLIAEQGKSRYVQSNLWQNLQDDETQRLSDIEEGGDDDDDDDDQAPLDSAPVEYPEDATPDPLTGAFMGTRKNLLRYHPTPGDAIKLWEIHLRNVEPICKILHIPSARRMVERVSKEPQLASKTEECQLFAIYHFAIYSSTETACLNEFEQPREKLLQTYNFAARQALVNASFLRTSELSVLQALVLYLQACRFFYDSQTYWVLAGVATRIAHRLGLHRDGKDQLGLPPFEVQMRRRLFYQLLPLEGIASQLAGAGLSIFPDTWDTQAALNINDEQIWPGMTEEPVEQEGATEMMFCLTRLTIGKHFARRAKPNDSGPFHFQDYAEAEETIRHAEKEVEEKYIRYCDVVNPLHFLSMGLARAGIITMKLRLGLGKARRDSNMPRQEKRELLNLTMRLLDTDAAIHSHEGVKRYEWHVKPTSLWGSWDSVIFMLTNMLRGDLVLDSDVDEIWDKIEQMFEHHPEMTESRRALYLAFGRLALRAWESRPPSKRKERGFIEALRLRQRNKRTRNRNQKRNQGVSNLDEGLGPSNGASPGTNTDGLGPSPETFCDMMGADFEEAFGLDERASWCFWDELIKQHSG